MRSAFLASAAVSCFQVWPAQVRPFQGSMMALAVSAPA
jgi:hypothetical protein